MNLTAWLDVAIGLSVIYLGASLVVTIINEYIAQILNLRGRNLRASLKELIDDTELVAKLKDYPALKAFLGTETRKVPSYVDSAMFAKLMLGSLAQDGAETDAAKRTLGAIEALPNSKLKSQLQAIVKTSASNIEDITRAVSEWTDQSLTTLGEAYKKRLQWITLVVGLVASVAFNVDTIALTTHLYKDKEAREAAAEVGVRLTETTSKEQLDTCLGMDAKARKADTSCAELMGLVDAVQSRNATLGKLPIGWDHTSPVDQPAFALKLLGWLLTALSLSLGAPFWFDVLNRFASVRHGMRKPAATKSTA